MLVFLLMIFVSLLNRPPYGTLEVKFEFDFQITIFLLRPNSLFLVVMMIYLQELNGGNDNLFFNFFFWKSIAFPMGC
jgi:hypothetical protein